MLDGEHAPNDISTFIPQLMALKGSHSAPVVRPPCNEPVIIKRLLDIGFYNFLIPFVETEEEAVRAVASTRYPLPVFAVFLSVIVAMRSVPNLTISPPSTTTSRCWCRSKPRKVSTTWMPLRRLTVWTVFLSDRAISAALGYLGQPNHPEVQKVIRHIFERAAAHGKPSGILAPVEADARRYLEWGASFVAVGSDLGVFRGATAALCDKFKKSFE